MQTWIEPLREACPAWEERTGLPASLVVNPLLDYTGAYQFGRTEYRGMPVDSLRAWFGRLVADPGIHPHFLVFAAIRANESFLANWLDRLPADLERASRLNPHGRLATGNFDEELAVRQRAFDAWRELALPILAGTMFAGPPPSGGDRSPP